VTGSKAFHQFACKSFANHGITTAAAIKIAIPRNEKRRLSGATSSAALRADAAQSALCAYLSLIATSDQLDLARKWADPIAALAVLPLIVWEGREAIRGKTCGCC